MLLNRLAATTAGAKTAVLSELERVFKLKAKQQGDQGFSWKKKKKTCLINETRRYKQRPAKCVIAT